MAITNAADVQQSDRAAAFNFNQFRFGETPTDHMFVAEYRNGKWCNQRLTAFNSVSLSPFSLCFHYGQTVFEGMKAFRLADGGIIIFRPDKHFDRFNKSLERMCMPAISENIFYGGLKAVVQKDQSWLPYDNPEVALYIRPFMIATEARLGVKVSTDYLFAIVCTPIGQYYDHPLKVKVETNWVRAAEGGAGYAKCGGNYGAAFYATQKAKEQGYDQVIWTDAARHQYLEESGTMNIMLIKDDCLITPALSNTILDGVTRNSLIQIAKDFHWNIEERPIGVNELTNDLKDKNRFELFGAGTAALISPIACVNIAGVDYYPYVGADAKMFQLKKALDDLHRGIIEDQYGWNYLID